MSIFSDYIQKCIEDSKTRKRLVEIISYPNFEYTTLQSLRVELAVKKGRTLKSLAQQLEFISRNSFDSKTSGLISEWTDCEFCKGYKQQDKVAIIGDKVSFTHSTQRGHSISFNSCEGNVFGYTENGLVVVLYRNSIYKKRPESLQTATGKNGLTVSMGKTCECKK